MRFNVNVNTGALLWVRRACRGHWATLLVFAVIVAIGGGATVASMAAAHRTETAFPRMLDVTNEPNLLVQALEIDNGRFSGLDPTLLDRVMEIPGVEGVWQFAFIGVAAEGYDQPFNIASVERRGEGTRFSPIYGSGIEQLEQAGPEVVLANEEMLDELGATVGDTVNLRTLTPDEFVQLLTEDAEVVGSGPKLTAVIAGVGRSAAGVSDNPDPFLLFSRAFYDTYKSTVGSCVCVIDVTAEPDQLDAVANQLRAIYPNASVDPGENLSARLEDTVALQRRAWWAIAAVAALATAIVLIQAGIRFGRALAADDDTLAALGLTTRERRLARSAVMLPAVLIGSAAAGVLAFALSGVAPVGITAKAEPEPGLRWDPMVVLPGAVGVLLGSIAIIAATSAAAGRHRQARLGRTVGATDPVRALGVRFAFGPGRGAIVGAVLATAGLVGVLSLQQSIDHVLATPRLYGADFDASIFLDSGADIRMTATMLAADRDIDAAALVLSQQNGQDAEGLLATSQGGSLAVFPRAFENVKDEVAVLTTAGRAPLRPDEAAVGAKLLDQLSIAIGNQIMVEGRGGPVQLTVVGEYLDPSGDISGLGFVMTQEGLSALADTAVDGSVYRFAAASNHGEVLDRYADLGLEAVNPPSEVRNIGELGGLPNRAAQLLVLLGLAAMFNSVVQTVRIGRRPLAIHRALGFTTGQVTGVHMWQAAVTAVLAVGAGGAIGLVVGRAIHRQLVENVGAIAESVVPGGLWSIAAGIAAVCVLAGLTATVAALRQPPGVALRAE